MKDKNIKIVSFLAMLLIMLVIFLFSAQSVEQSSKMSREIAEQILNFFKTVFPIIHSHTKFNAFHILLRKAAHFTLYFLLGMLCTNALRRNGLRHLPSISLSFLFCVLFAFSDEGHQLFVHGRGAQLRDVGIDSLGSAAGIMAYLILSGFWRLVKRIFRSKQL